jgi:hypothetical protein
MAVRKKGLKIRLPRQTRTGGSEERIQVAVFKWAADNEKLYPELCTLYAIPNAGKRSSYSGARLRESGLRAGVPDLCLPVPRGGFGSLYIELKKGDTSRVSLSQKIWVNRLRAHGSYAVVCRSYQDAIKTLELYLNWKRF